MTTAPDDDTPDDRMWVVLPIYRVAKSVAGLGEHMTLAELQAARAKGDTPPETTTPRT